jgi:hypothetical protein
MHYRVLFVAFLLTAGIPQPGGTAGGADASSADPGGNEFFERKVRPVLARHCYACHSAEAEKKRKLRAGLRLDSRDGVRKGGDSGPAIVPGKPDDSLLIQSVRYDGDPAIGRCRPRESSPTRSSPTSNAGSAEGHRTPAAARPVREGLAPG